MSSNEYFNLRQTFTKYYSFTPLEKTDTTGYLNTKNAATALKYLSFTSIITPFAVGIAHTASVGIPKLCGKVRYGFETVAFKALLPAQLVYKFSFTDEMISGLKKECPIPEETWSRTFVTADGTKLEGAYLPGKGAAPSNKTMIYFVGSGDHFATELASPLTNTFLKHGYNIILFNYRGVGASDGHATKEGLFQDGEAVYKYARDLGVKEEDILLYGHSIGAAIASNVVKDHPNVKFCHERSFTRLDKAATSLITNSLKSHIGHPLASIIGRVAGAAVRGLNLNIDTREAFDSGNSENRLAVFHPEDQLIDDTSSMKSHLIAENKSSLAFSLNPEEGDPHNRWVTKREAEMIHEYFHPTF